MSFTISPLRLFLAAALLGLPFAARAQDAGWQADPERVRQAGRDQPAFNYDEHRVPPYALPELFPAGTAQTPEAWAARRAELLEQFREHVYGRSPARPEALQFQLIEEDPGALNGAATLRRIAVQSSRAGRTHAFELTLFLPNDRRAPVPVFLLLNNRGAENTDPTRRVQSGFWPAEAVIARGFGIAALQNDELAPDEPDRFREGIIRLYEDERAGDRPRNAWGALAAWAWGAQRAMDYFETDSRVDAAKIALVGHSRGGKAALWAGAEDERFALVVSNESGEGGAALSRRRFGETTARITEVFPHWFADRYRDYGKDPSALPVDQHMLLALIAPRALYVASADEDLWADPRGEFLALAHTSPVYALRGEPAIEPGDMPPLDQPLRVGSRGYHIRSGNHDLTAYDWARFLDFAETLWPD